MTTKQVKIITGWDENNDIYLLYRENDKRKIKIIRNYQWYFSISTTEYKTLLSLFWQKYLASKIITKFEVGEKYTKIYCNKKIKRQTFTGQQLRYVSEVEFLLADLKRKKITTYEGDLSLLKRYMIDGDIEIEENLKVLFFDIETDDTINGLAIGRDRILSIGCCDTLGNTYFYSGDEKKLISEFIHSLDEYDIISGWNSERFDLPYIQARMQAHSLYYDWRRTIHIDLIKRCIKLYSYEMEKIGLTGFSLNAVSSCFLNNTKIEFEGKVIDLYNNNFAKFKEYNLKDVQLLNDLNKKLNLIDVMILETIWTGSLLKHFYVGELLDYYILRDAKKRGLCLPTKPTFQETEQNKELHIIGGYVQTPTTGLFDDVWIFDFKGLYPSLIIGWNISHDTINKELSKEGEIAFDKLLNHEKVEELKIDDWLAFLKTEKQRLDPDNLHYQTPNNLFFTNSKQGFISSLIKHLIKLKEEYKKELVKTKVGTPEYADIRSKRWVAKELANSMFGINADRRSRYFNKNIAEAITVSGQLANKLAAKLIIELGFNCIYGDTDSLFISDLTSTNIEQLTNDINDKLKQNFILYFNLDDYVIAIEPDKKYRKLIMLDKKRYTGWMEIMNDQPVDILFSKGTEDVRKNTIELTKRKMIELVTLITKKNESIKNIHKWVAKLKERILKSDEILSEDLAITTRLSKSVHQYKSEPVHVRLAKKLIKEGKLLDTIARKNSWGEQIKYIITSGVGKNEAILLDEFDGEWDRYYYWNIRVYKPLKRVLDIVYPDINWDQYLISKQQQLNPNQLQLFK